MTFPDPFHKVPEDLVKQALSTPGSSDLRPTLTCPQKLLASKARATPICEQTRPPSVLSSLQGGSELTPLVHTSSERCTHAHLDELEASQRQHNQTHHLAMLPNPLAPLFVLWSVNGATTDLVARIRELKVFLHIFLSVVFPRLYHPVHPPMAFPLDCSCLSGSRLPVLASL